MSAMQYFQLTALQRALTVLAGLLVLKVTVAVTLGFYDYFPPNFDSGFLQGREDYFAGPYQWAFYTHIVSGPCSLIWGLLLISERFRLRFPDWHRFLGRIQVLNVLFLVTPSGLWMARYALTGPIAGIGFALLAVATGWCAVQGWRSAVRRRFAEHRRWMWRCFLLLCSAVVIRIIGGTATVTDFDAPWLYPAASWLSWLVPLTAFELTCLIHRPGRHTRAKTVQGVM